MTTLTTRVGGVTFTSPLFAASGTAGHGDELADYGDLSDLGAIVTKSLAAFSFEGNPPPRLATSGPHMVNAVGLAGPGVASWRSQYLPALRHRNATVVDRSGTHHRRVRRRRPGHARCRRGCSRSERELSESRESPRDLRSLAERDG